MLFVTSHRVERVSQIVTVLYITQCRTPRDGLVIMA